jgi:hypothetical protein
MRRIDRREFAREASLAFLSGVTVTISACGGGGYSSPTTPSNPSGSTGDEVGQISNNHGHVAVIQAAWLTAGTPVQFDIAGSGGHSHIVSLPAAAMLDIREGRPVQTDSSTTDGHNHTVTFNADNPAPPTRYGSRGYEGGVHV